MFEVLWSLRGNNIDFVDLEINDRDSHCWDPSITHGNLAFPSVLLTTVFLCVFWLSEKSVQPMEPETNTEKRWCIDSSLEMSSKLRMA